MNQWMESLTEVKDTWITLTQQIESLTSDEEETNHDSGAELLTGFMFKLPVMLPLIWLAIFTSKRRSEAVRLQQEYAHKEALAKSYKSFKTQAEDLGQEDTSLQSKLLETAIDAIALNQSETLDKKHGDKTPVHETVDSLIPKIEQKDKTKKALGVKDKP